MEETDNRNRLMNSIENAKEMKNNNLTNGPYQTVYLLRSGNDPKNEECATKTKIIYRVLNPEDLNLYDPEERPPPKSASTTQRRPTLKRALKLKGGGGGDDDSETKTPRITSITRSGRRVRPPNRGEYARTDSDRDNIDADPHLESVVDVKSTMVISSRRRHGCPACKKVYHSLKRIARHLVAYPDHAVSPKSIEILEKFKNTNFGTRTADAECQTENLLALDENASRDLKSYRSSKAEKEEKSPFRILIGILQRTPPELRAGAFVRQLARLIFKLRKLVPRFLKESGNDSSCVIDETVGKILDLAPGEYKFNMDVFSGAESPSDGRKRARRCENSFRDGAAPYKNLWKTEKRGAKRPSTSTDPSVEWTPSGTGEKWIPIGVDGNATARNGDWLLSNCDVLANDGKINSWEAALRDRDGKESDAGGNSWISNTIRELSNVDPTREPPARSPAGASDGNVSAFERKDDGVELDPSLVFEIDRATARPRGNFDFSGARFDVGIDADKLDFADVGYDALPPFTKIEPKNVQRPVGSADATADRDGSRAASNGPMLESGFPLAPEVAVDANENAVRGALLADPDLSLPMTVPDGLNEDGSILSVGESALDEAGLNLSSDRSVLNLLDPLGADCLSFSDADLNSRSSQMSLDLQLDLFPFHHS